MDLQDKVILITGAAGGIGREIAVLASQQGAKVALADLNRDGGEATLKIVQDAGGEGFFVRVNVASADSVENFVAQVIERYGALHGAVNNAGVGGDLTASHELSEKSWDFVMNVNAKGVWLCMKYELPHMLENGGAIVNVASVAGLIAMRNNLVYTASKHAVIGMTKAVAAEYARYNIRANALCPGFTDTQMVGNIDELAPGLVNKLLKAVPMRRLGNVSEIAEGALFLLSDRSTFITGHSLVLDGGILTE